jgi:hypothetical protein
MTTSKRATKVRVDYVIENGAWTAKCPRIDAGKGTLRAVRNRVGRQIAEVYGPDIEVEAKLHLPAVVHEHIAKHKELRKKASEIRAALRQDTAKVLDLLRNDMGLSYEDAGELIGVDAAALLRTVHSTQTVKLPDEDW